MQSGTSLGAEPIFGEYELKAAFLCQLPAFVIWPPANQPADEIKMCIVGTDPFGEKLDYLAAQMTSGTNMIVARLEPNGDISDCSIVFLGSMKRDLIAAVLEPIAGQAILTVSESADFTRTGGMVRFVVPGGHVGFEINRIAVAAGGLRVKAQLLKISNIVEHALPAVGGRVPATVR